MAITVAIENNADRAQIVLDLVECYLLYQWHLYLDLSLFWGDFCLFTHTTIQLVEDCHTTETYNKTPFSRNIWVSSDDIEFRVCFSCFAIDHVFVLKPFAFWQPRWLVQSMMLKQRRNLRSEVLLWLLRGCMTTTNIKNTSNFQSHAGGWEPYPRIGLRVRRLLRS